MLQLALSLSSIIIWLKTHEIDPTKSRFKLPPDTFKIEQMFLCITFCCTHIYYGSKSIFIGINRHMRIKKIGCNTDSQHFSKPIKIQELATSGFQKKHQAFIIIFKDMFEHQ